MRWCRACVHTERQLSRLSSSPPIHHHLLLVCCRRTPPRVLVSHPLCAVSCQLCRVHLWCVFHLPSIVAVLCDHVVYQTQSCQAPATGAAPQLHRTVPLKRRPARPGPTWLLHVEQTILAGVASPAKHADSFKLQYQNRKEFSCLCAGDCLNYSVFIFIFAAINFSFALRIMFYRPIFLRLLNLCSSPFQTWDR